jgi:hypothetical protein
MLHVVFTSVVPLSSGPLSWALSPSPTKSGSSNEMAAHTSSGPPNKKHTIAWAQPTWTFPRLALGSSMARFTPYVTVISLKAPPQST